MSQPFRIDWEQIKTLWSADDHRVLILDQRAIQFLLGVMPRLHWKATYNHSALANTDWDYLERLAADTENSLGTAMKVSDLIQYIDEIEPLLRALNTHAGCCETPDPTNGAGSTDYVKDGTGNVPQNIIDAGYASGTSDWTGFYAYKCMISHLIIDDLERKLRDLLPHFDTTGQIIGGVGTVAAIIVSVLAALSTGGISLIVQVVGSVGAAAAVWSAISGFGETVTEGIADDVSTYHESLACAVYYSDGVEMAIANLNDKIDDLFSASVAILLKNMNLEPTLRALYAGRYDTQDVAQNLADAGYATSGYDCSCLGEFGCTDNLLDDCGFESGHFGAHGWVQVNTTTGHWFSTTEKHAGNYGIDSNVGSGGNQHIMQEITADKTGTLNFSLWGKSHSATYGPWLAVYHWTGSVWSQVYSAAFYPTRNGTWQQKSQAIVAVTSGHRYEIRLHDMGYYYVDDVRAWIP